VNRLIPFIVILAILAWLTQSGSLFFLLLVFAGIVLAAKKLKKASPAKDPADLPPWQRALQNVVAEIRRELQQRAGQQPSQTQGTPWSWEQLLKPPPETVPEAPPADTGPPDETPSEKRVKRPKMAAPAKEAEKKKAPVPSSKREPAPGLMPPPAPAAARTVADELEQAIIWSEIISPPLALRDRD
jgi:hypothetical protein